MTHKAKPSRNKSRKEKNLNKCISIAVCQQQLGLLEEEKAI